MSQRRILVTSALPYANGPIHIGHMVEYLQTDIWARFQRLRGHECRYICADDTHGTPIMLRARQEGRSELEVIAEAQERHQADFADFGVSFDHFGSTNSDTNRRRCAEIWQRLNEAQLVEERAVVQLFDPEAGMFLADRFVKGTCPRCQSPNQNGDSCDSCGATYAPTDLLNPKSKLSGATPVTKSANHLFIKVETSHDFLTQWTQESGRLQPGIANYLQGQFLGKPLQDWDVSRPAPYFGFEIPGHPGDYWYVWFDAPIGYMAATEEWCEKSGASFDDFWRSEETELVHFIGKDIVYFHALFWPAVLRATGYRLPRRIHVHGMLVDKGAKMSKSSGKLVMARTYLDHLDPAYLRYYYATRLSTKADDIEFDVVDFEDRVNSDLVGKVVNLASRTARFVQKTGLSKTYPSDEGLFAAGVLAGQEIADAYEACDTSRAMRTIMALADRANEYVARQAPWTLAKQPGKEQEVQDTCTVALNLFRQLVVYLAPVLPEIAKKSGEFLGTPLDTWRVAETPLVGASINEYQHLMQRVQREKIQSMLASSVEAPA
jgi:methionyl-tRNA synthetase